MPFAICDKAGIAWKLDEYGAHKWSSEDNEFSNSMPAEEVRDTFPRRQVRESEAIAFSLANSPATKPTRS